MKPTRSTRKPARIRIREARAEEFERLREIAIAAKGHWGYEPALVQEWALGGDFEPKSLSKRLVYVAVDEAEGEPIGWASLIPRGEVGWLEDLWIEPDWIGRGLGACSSSTSARARVNSEQSDSNGRPSQTRAVFMSGWAPLTSAIAMRPNGAECSRCLA